MDLAIVELGKARERVRLIDERAVSLARRCLCDVVGCTTEHALQVRAVRMSRRSRPRRTRKLNFGRLASRRDEQRVDVDRRAAQDASA